MITGLFLSAMLAWSAPQEYKYEVKNAKQEVVGHLTLTPLATGVKLNLEVKGLPPGERAVHFHENGSCVGPKFESAGGHFNPKKHEHGFDSRKGPHAGDMPNIVVGKDGHAKIEFINTMVRMGKEKNSLLKTGGTALVIHETTDDYKSQPAGNAGARIACAEIK